MKEIKEILLYPTIILCNGCSNRIAYCSCKIYTYPEAQHTRIGGCAMDTRKIKATKDDFKLNPLKASKRQMNERI